MAPWQPADASRHNRSVKSPKRKRQWSAIANSVLKSSGDEGKAIRIANGVVKKTKRAKKRSTHRP
jgi:hypothetical protein